MWSSGRCFVSVMLVGKPCPYCYSVPPKLAARRNKFGFRALPGASFQWITCITYQEFPRVTAFHNIVSQMHKACLYSLLYATFTSTDPTARSTLLLPSCEQQSSLCITHLFLLPFSFSHFLLRHSPAHRVWKCCPSKNWFLLSSRKRNSPHSRPLPSPASPTFRRSCHFWVSISQQGFNTFYSSRFFSVCIVLVSRSARQFWENLVCIILFLSLHYSSDSRIQTCCAL